MKARMMIGLAFVCMFGFAGLQTSQEYFQKALSKERAEGNLREAIVLYQKAIEASKDESLAAKAQLQIGLCYEEARACRKRKRHSTSWSRNIQVKARPSSWPKNDWSACRWHRRIRHRFPAA